MRIQFHNILDGDQTTSQILMVAGVVVAWEPRSCGHVISAHLDGESFHSDVCSKGDFKILVRLKVGHNTIHFSCGNLSRHVQIVLEIPPVSQPLIKLAYIAFQESNGHSDDAPYDIDLRSAASRISLMGLLVQSFMSETMASEFEERSKTIALELNEETRMPICHILHLDISKDRASRMTQKELWSTTANEIFIKRKFSIENSKFIAITSPIKNRDVEKPISLGIGGLALVESKCLLTWPENLPDVQRFFSNETPLDTSFGYRRTYGGCYSLSFGAVLHELGHCLDLAHQKRGIMGTDYSDIDNFFLIQDRNVANSIEDSLIASDSFRNRQQMRKMIKLWGFASWFRPCSKMLFHHRWLNAPSKGNIWHDGKSVVKSTWPIAFVEFRDSSGNSLNTLEPNTDLIDLRMLHFPSETDNVFFLNEQGHSITFSMKKDV